MRKRSLRYALGLFGLVVAVTVWYFFRPELLFIDRTVHEEFPMAVAPARDEMPPESTQPPAAEGAAEEMQPAMADEAAEEMQPAAAQPPAEPVQLASGSFRGIAHVGSGNATIYQLADGRRVLRFSEFDVENGPDLYVYMVAADDADDSATVTRAGFVSLGRLKGNIGDQNYELPADLDLSKYRSVSIWCQRFSVNFAIAPLR